MSAERNGLNCRYHVHDAISSSMHRSWHELNFVQAHELWHSICYIHTMASHRLQMDWDFLEWVFSSSSSSPSSFVRMKPTRTTNGPLPRTRAADDSSTKNVPSHAACEVSVRDVYCLPQSFVTNHVSLGLTELCVCVRACKQYAPMHKTLHFALF